MRKLANLAAVAAIGIALSACAQRTIETVRVVNVYPTPVECPAPPAVPDPASATQRDLADFAVVAWTHGMACHANKLEQDAQVERMRASERSQDR